MSAHFLDDRQHLVTVFPRGTGPGVPFTRALVTSSHHPTLRSQSALRLPHCPAQEVEGQL